MKSFNKFLFKIFLSLLLIASLSISLISCGGKDDPPGPDPIIPDPIPTPLIDLDEYDAYYIVSSYGEDSSTMININYHTKNTKTSVEYTLASDENFTNAIVVLGNCFVFEPEDPLFANPFEARNVCQVSIKDLTPNTAYIYRVNKGDNTYSNTYHFKTSGSNSTTSFLFMTDIHYYAASDNAKASEYVINSALELQPNISFLLTTGDIIDRGGNPGDWDMYFSQAKSLALMPFFGVPGNHEYYDVSQGNNYVFSSHYHFPKNGVESYVGVSYFFIHNDTLFFQIDTDNKINFNEQLNWMERTILAYPTKFIIVGTHRPMHQNTIDYNPKLMALMDKYSVDLVLAGHYHSDSYTELFNGVKPTNPYLGVTYMNGVGGGVKSMPEGTDPKEFAKGYIIDIENNQIIIRQINGNGKVLKTRTINSKKTAPKQDATKEELLDSITLNYLAENKEIKISWSEKFYKNVKKMEIAALYREMTKESIVFPSPGYTSYTIKNINPDFEYAFKLTITFDDLTTSTKELFWGPITILNIEATNIANNSITLVWDLPKETYSFYVKEYRFYLNGKLVKSQNSLDDKFNQVVTTILGNLESKKTYELKLEVYGRDGYMYHDTYSFTTK